MTLGAISSFVSARLAFLFFFFFLLSTYELEKTAGQKAGRNAFAGGLGPTGSRWHVSLQQREQPPAAKHPAVVRKQFSRAAWIAYFWSSGSRPLSDPLCVGFIGEVLCFGNKSAGRGGPSAPPSLLFLVRGNALRRGSARDLPCPCLFRGEDGPALLLRHLPPLVEISGSIWPAWS